MCCIATKKQRTQFYVFYLIQYLGPDLKAGSTEGREMRQKDILCYRTFISLNMRCNNAVM
jgi:hypothetical protein